MTTDLLVTGGAGFIGSSVVRVALERGLSVRVIDNFATGSKENLDGLDVDVREGSITEMADVRSALQGVGAVVHLAALPSVPRSLEDPAATNEINVLGTLNVLEGMREAGIDAIAAASSSSVYGRNPTMPKLETDWVAPMSPYAVSKLAAEQYVLAYQSSFGFRSTAFRFFNVYGPRQPAGVAYSAVVPSFIHALLRGEALEVHGDGLQSRDFTYVDSVANALVGAAQTRLSSEQPDQPGVRHQHHAAGADRAPEQDHRDSRRRSSTLEPRAGDVRHSQADPQLFQELLPHVAPTELEAGLVETVAWHRSHPIAMP